MRERVLESKYNAGIVDILFQLMFETLWTAPYDRRRGNPLLGDFDRCVRRAVVMLSTTDLASASAVQLREVSESVGSLAISVRRIADAGLFSPGRCAAALELVAEVTAAVEMGCMI